MTSTSPDMVFEASWEVTNKAGGIYTVVTSKVQLMQATYSSYYLIGPLLDQVPDDFIEEHPPEPFLRAFSALSRQGITCVYGTWDIPGKPKTILIRGSADLNRIKTELWDRYGVDSLFARRDFDEPLRWAWSVGAFIAALKERLSQSAIVGHFHEWLAGSAVLYLDQHGVDVGTVFTTHATMLGRTLASKKVDIYNQLESINPDEAARKYGIQEKHTMEKACANVAKVFTTVSSITAKECKAFFGRDPDLLPNGLEIDRFPTFEDAHFRHLKYKEKLADYVMTHFFSYQQFDLSKTLYFYFGGRYEYGNKGLDIIIESLKRLNEHLQGTDRTVVMFFFIAWDAGRPKQELLDLKQALGTVMDLIRDQSEMIQQRLALNVLMDGSVELLPAEYVTQLRKETHLLHREGVPPLCTHNIDEERDRTLAHLRAAGLTNNPDDRVKVVFMPAYLDGEDGLLDLTFYEAVSGAHLGIFPSYYEPWGYTPLESLAFGVPAVTSDTAGFGQHIQRMDVDLRSGLRVVPRSKGDAAAIDNLYDHFLEILDLSHDQRLSLKRNAHALSTYADWRQLVKHYFTAHTKALR